MFFPSFSKPSYTALADGEYTDEDVKSGEPLRPVLWYRNTSRKSPWMWVLVICTLAGLSASWTLAMVKWSSANHQAGCSSNPSKHCLRPAIRREWRTLAQADRSAYIAAVKCLTTRPSNIFSDGSLYDDFPRVHQSTAPTAHKAAPFLPWHRYFVHAYESALKQECGYSGVIPYWDWSQDWEDMTKAPVWAAEGGFGGNGNTDTATTVGEGHCVDDGPFANLKARYFGDRDQAHCLSRGFASEFELRRLGSHVSPGALEDLRDRSGTFEEYATELEHRAHSFMRDGVRGDFRAYTGPYDPVFFLHHVNLDRLWALWQDSAVGGLSAYGGPRYNATEAPAATLDDPLDLGGLLPSLSVADMMDTTDGILCYQY